MLNYVVAILALVACALVVGFLRRKATDENRGSPSLPLRQNPASEPPAALAMRNWLIGEEGEVQGLTFHIGERTVTVGRGTGNFVQLDDEGSSRVHCQLKSTAAGVVITDMKSANGTNVGGQKIRQHTLVDGDQIRIGKVMLVFRVHAQAKADAGVARKSIGAIQSQKTTFALNLDGSARDAMTATGGDIDAAAQRIGMTPDELRLLLGLGGLAASGRDE